MNFGLKLLRYGELLLSSCFQRYWNILMMLNNCIIQPWWLGSSGRYSRIQLKSTFWRSVDRIPSSMVFLVFFKQIFIYFEVI